MTLLLDRPDLAAALDAVPALRWTTPARPAPRVVRHPHAPGLELSGAGRTVPLAGGGHIEYANLDAAASAPALAAVERTVAAVVEQYASVHRGAGWHSRVCTELYEGARRPVRDFVGGRPTDAVIFTRNTTDSLNLLAHCLPARTTVVVFETEHHAALLPWVHHHVIRLPAPASPAEAVALVDDALRRRPAGPALLVITGASNVTGELWPVGELAAVARSRGARVALDAAQLAPHRPFSITELGVDYVALSGHKLYAPYGTGALVGPADWLDQADPYLLGGGATATVTDDAVTFKPVPERHEAGTPNVLGAVALATACHLLAGADHEALATAEHLLTDRLRDGLSAIPGVTVHTLFGSGGSGRPDGPGSEADEVPGIGVATFTVTDRPAALVAAALSAEYGIGVRDGAFCAHPLVRRLLGAAGCADSGADGQAVRASIGLGTTSEHVERLIAAVRRIALHGPRLQYVVRDGRPVPAIDDRATPVIAPWQ
ncbi:aminotransferase class V-fold PLP-dependent enzyme [Nakamurella flavida]|uniref:Aminotransferase class V-fold PLP-dependent enzyme n=1 Tax=Nakamurella flavida TaxID=363630 RepID=A0A939C009_9ACTN|nr:aminotransferase class V-fold PLP-dependent enzyme [Nakamurella flavida]MBM9476233.1 aminotransferase class V-fold PLP-dependent enzyme [Nakamurella flavida]MDP9779669.1 selenocysteine lyase/cysteine desulfurase [Nakamurella flavida]